MKYVKVIEWRTGCLCGWKLEGIAMTEPLGVAAAREALDAHTRSAHGYSVDDLIEVPLDQQAQYRA